MTEHNQSGSKAPSEEPKLDSPLKPLLWVLVPFALVLLYGIFSGG